MRTGILVALALVCAVLALTACDPIDNLLAEKVSLEGPVWQLTRLDGNPPVPGTTVTAEFDPDGTLGGSAGCNSYSGTYKINGQKISIGPLMSTQMACLQPVMDQELEYLAVLQVADTFEIKGNVLSLLNSAGTTLATYTVQDQDLAGTSWQVIAYNDGREAVISVIPGTELTAGFGTDGQVTGTGGCNSYFGPYAVDGDSISIGPLGSTEMACEEPEGSMGQESAYLSALQSTATYRIQGANMEMRTAEGTLAVTFQRLMGQ